MKKYFYLYQADLARGYPRVKRISETSIPEYNSQGELLREYQADTLPERLIMDDSGVVREPTLQERYDLAQRFDQEYVVPVGMYVKNGAVKAIPERPVSLLNPKFDVEQETWLETATSEQVEERATRMKKWAYLDELKCYGYARSEYELNLISDVNMMLAAKYMKALAAGDEEVTRPEWFNRYSS
jgi:hypothetical protein